MRRVMILAACAGVLAPGCLERDLASLNPCLVSGVTRRITAESIDKVDLLFVVDDSSSMHEEQEALKLQFPRLVRTLTSGVRFDGTRFSPVKSLHLGVVSSDMGLTGVRNPWGCDPIGGGDDGRLQHAGGQPGCQPSYPPFLTFELGRSDPDQVAHDFGCIATLGTGGCGFEQQLEAGLKALWPGQYIDVDGNARIDNPIRFVSTTRDGMLGHGDRAPTRGGNGGFLRNEARGGLSLVAIVIVSDEEDCSSLDTSHFTSDPGDPRSQQPPNLRCFMNKQNLFGIERYVQGFKALRPGREHLVMFGAIVGVPPDLVSREQRDMFGGLADEASRAAYYRAILDDPRMQERPNGLTGEHADLVPSCTADSSVATAYPPVRIVQVAQEFGANGVVQSICQSDFRPAMDAIIDLLTTPLELCLPKPLVRKANGTVPCNVIWELPAPSDVVSAQTPTECTGPGTFLEPVDPGRPAVNSRGGQNCKVKQLAAGGTRSLPAEPGWYYDDFGDDLPRRCAGRPQRVSFTESAIPPNGVVVTLECVNETQHVPSTDTRRAPDQPEIGSPCGDRSGADDACAVRFQDGHLDHSMFCHPELNVCVRGCRGDAECPAAWVCDDRLEVTANADGRPFCVNPTCGSD